MEILVYYGVGPRTERLIKKLGGTHHVSQVGVILRRPVQGLHGGVSQGNPLLRKIFNVQVDAVIRHWATVVAREGAGKEGFGRGVQKIAALFYADDGLLTYPRTARL